MTDEQARSYYDGQRARLLKEFDRLAPSAREVLAAYYGPAAAADILDDMRCRYEALIPQIPYIGGRKNRLSGSLEGTVASLALYKALRARGEATEQIARVHHQMVETFLYSLPRWPFRLMRLFLSTPPARAFFALMIRRAAEASQLRRYPDDFVFRFVEGDGRTFDFGIDYQECAVVKFFRAQGAEEFNRYVCLYDYPHSRLAGTGLVRTATLAEGAPCCDFRFRFGREPENRQVTRIENL
jgi:hypothetical protein